MVTGHQELIGRHFLSLWKQNSAAAAAAAEGMGGVEDEVEKMPMELNTVNIHGGFLNVKPDKLSVQYTGVNLHGYDVGVVQADRAAPVKRLCFYFEIYIKNAGSKGQIAIGYTTHGFRMRRQPGWEPNSYGYHGDDGFLYRGHGKGETFGPKYSAGDTVGAGVNYASQEFFFTKNGEVVGTVAKDVKGPLFPTIAVHSQNEEVRVNFGKEPFVFDIKAFEMQERAKQQLMIEKISLPQDTSYGIVRSYLLHYGYEDTLKLLDMAGKSSTPIPLHLESFSEKEIMYALDQRKALRQLIRSGEIDEAFVKLRSWYPEIVQDDKSATCFLLHCQKFIELVRAGKLEEAVVYGRTQFEKFHSLPEFLCLLKDCAALLAYEEPQNSAVGYLLEHSHREMVADNVNAMILSTNSALNQPHSCCLHSYLERLLRQLSACYLERRSLNGDQGETFNLSKVLSSYKMG